MFKDYYSILEIPFQATSTEIKSAYRKQALKWHPDLHPNMDVKSMMQDINEAYAILKDPIKKSKYDMEYILFLQSQENKEIKKNEQDTSRTTSNNKKYEYDYSVKDEDLKEEIKNAREYSKKIVDDFFESLKKNSKLAVKGAWDGSRDYIWSFMILFIIGLLIKLFMA